MKYKWLNKKENNKIILFFNGWGMDENVIKHLECEDYDVLMFYNYNSLDTDFDFSILNRYSEKNLIAWSMGVMVASLLTTIIHPFYLFFNQCRRVYINGTLKPIDEKFGIHPKIYDLTIKGFNEKGRDKFISSMFDVQPPSLTFFKERDVQEQLSELVALKNVCKISPISTPAFVDEALRYNKILISDNDKIIPTKSQVSFWGIEPNLHSGHCPFFSFKKWSELL